MIMRRAIAAAVLLLSPLPALMPADGRADVIRLVTGDDDPPFSGQALPEGGLATDIIRQVFRSTGANEVAIDWLPWKRGYQEAERAAYDGTFSYVPTPERQAVFLFSDPVFVVRKRVYSLASRPIDYRELGDLAGRVVCAPLAWALDSRLAALVEQGVLRREEPSDRAGCIRMMQQGRADFFTAADFEVARIAALSGLWTRDLFVATPMLQENGKHLIVARGHPNAQALIERFNRGLARLRERGDYGIIVTRHLGGGHTN